MGRSRTATASRSMLAMIAIPVQTLGQNRVKASVYFIPTAHPVSNNPAHTKISHGLTTTLLRNKFVSASSCLDRVRRVSSGNCSTNCTPIVPLAATEGQIPTSRLWKLNGFLNADCCPKRHARNDTPEVLRCHGRWGGGRSFRSKGRRRIVRICRRETGRDDAKMVSMR